MPNASRQRQRRHRHDARGLTGTLKNAWVVDFNDEGWPAVPRYVASLVPTDHRRRGGNYGFTTPSPVRRSSPRRHLPATPCTGFDDAVHVEFRSWIEAMAAEGITGGCGGNNFCPLNPVRRDQMAVFLLKGEHGSDFVPPACTGVFADVPCPGTFANWIEQLATEDITGGCGGNNYCPSTNNNRGQMAVRRQALNSSNPRGIRGQVSIERPRGTVAVSARRFPIPGKEAANGTVFWP